MRVESCTIDWVRRQRENDTLEMKSSFSMCQEYTKKLVVRDRKQTVQWAGYRWKTDEGKLTPQATWERYYLSHWNLKRPSENDLSWISRESNRNSSFWSHWFSQFRVYRIRSWMNQSYQTVKRDSRSRTENIFRYLMSRLEIFEIIVCRTWSGSDLKDLISRVIHQYDLDIISLSSNFIIFER